MNRVMLADDEPIVRKALQMLPDWQSMDCEVIYVASNGKEVLEHLEEMKPDILITDIKMPGADGIELAKFIWENKLPVQVIILTAYADFSYAQSAIRYGVVEYITKTGALEGLEGAVEKCRERMLNKYQKENVTDNATIENFFRTVYDGSLYEKDEIRQKCINLKLELGSYRVILFYLGTAEELSLEKKQSSYQKINEFLEEFFGEKLIIYLSVKKDIVCAVLKDIRKAVLKEQCCQIIKMSESFLPLRIWATISEKMSEAEELRTAYSQAEAVLEATFLEEWQGVCFFGEEIYIRETLMPQEEKLIEDIGTAIYKGEDESAVILFEQLLEKQRKAGYPASVIKQSGMSIQSRCRKLLAEYDESFFYGEERPGGIRQQIEGCMYFEEYREVMVKVLKNTAQVTGTVRSKKSGMVAECWQYIDEHYKELITVMEIATHIGVNASYLSRIFKEATGNTIIATINNRKLEQAKKYLKQTDMKIYEIADALGFENVTYFSHFFKKQTGVPPKDWMNKEESRNGSQE